LWISRGDWPDEIAELRDVLCSDERPIFSDIQLHEESLSTVKIFRDSNTVDEERPTKRQKVAKVSDQDECQASYKELVSFLNGSLEDSPSLELSGLHGTIV
jgi:serine/threonine-protein kinase ATR